MIKLQELADMAKEISSKKWFLNADEEVTAIDNDAGPDDTEEAFIGCAANIQLAKYIASANPETILNISEAFSALEQRAETAEAEVQRLNATTQPVSDGWVKCSERMPDDAQWCLVYTDYGQFAQCWSSNTNRGWLGDEISIPNIDVTHWMPLPAAPGGQDE